MTRRIIVLTIRANSSIKQRPAALHPQVEGTGGGFYTAAAHHPPAVATAIGQQVRRHV
jgi:hypothetical protein